jgi:hypothetical protein
MCSEREGRGVGWGGGRERKKERKRQQGLCSALCSDREMGGGGREREGRGGGGRGSPLSESSPRQALEVEEGGGEGERERESEGERAARLSLCMLLMRPAARAPPWPSVPCSISPCYLYLLTAIAFMRLGPSPPHVSKGSSGRRHPGLHSALVSSRFSFVFNPRFRFMTCERGAAGPLSITPVWFTPHALMPFLP